jgi:pSer/pThr/pTyr-binding forkhead associated (FHA) protein
LFKPETEGQNGFHSPVAVPQTELASGKAAAAVNLSSSGGSKAKPHAKLVIERGKSVGKQFMLSAEESHVGRWDADGGVFPDVDLDADDPEAKVSRRHARITRVDGNYFVEDMGSTNGTFINRGKRLPPGTRLPLNDGDEIIVGKTFLRFRIVK